MTNGSDVGAMLRGGAPPVIIARQAAVPVPHIAARSQPKTVQVEILRDGHTSESISFVHHRGAHSTEGPKRETVGSADPHFEIVGVESLAPAPVGATAASAAPGESVASTTGGRHMPRLEAASGMSFSRTPEENPPVAGPNSKTIDVP